ncbi:MAG: ATP-dependent helicase [Patescibacteria group bacterium]
MSERFVLHGTKHDAPSLRIDYGKELNDEQRAAVFGGDGPCLILAGAGSGKTRTITYRVAYLIEQGITPEQILLLTFTNKAAREMRERTEHLLGSSIDGIWSGTFHSIANRLLRMYADRVGYNRSFTILDSEDAKGAMKLVLKERNIDVKARRFPSPSVCLDIASYSRNVCGSIRETLEIKYPHFVELEPELVEIAAAYESRKRRTNAMDFDDLLFNLLLLLEDPVTGNNISSRFLYVLVDEFQDTNAIQARIVERLVSAHGNAFVVGDDAQSIYGFRGADVQNILSFPVLYPSASVFKLVTNYRSTPQILDLANASLSHNQDQFAKDLVGLRAPGEKPRLIPASSARQEAQYVAEQILALREEGTALPNIAVLFRASSHSQQLELELLKRDIPYDYRGGVKLFERAHIKDIMAHLRIFHNPKDEQAWIRLLLLRPGIGAAGAERASSELSKTDTIGAAIRTQPSALKSKASIGWKSLSDDLSRIAEVQNEPARMIRAIAASGYQEILEREYPNWRERLEDIESFALFAESYDSLETFLADVSLYDDVFAMRERGKGAEYDEERIVLSTVHQAKGLEWDAVFIIHVADGSFPNRRAMNEEKGIEEERRLFYVAVTRARKKLFLTYPLTLGADTLMLCRPSQFIEEVDPRLFERVELISPGIGSSAHRRSWSWDDGDAPWDGDDVIEVDRFGNRNTPSKKLPGVTVWKKK